MPVRGGTRPSPPPPGVIPRAKPAGRPAQLHPDRSPGHRHTRGRAVHGEPATQQAMREIAAPHGERTARRGSATQLGSTGDEQRSGGLTGVASTTGAPPGSAIQPGSARGQRGSTGIASTTRLRRGSAMQGGSHGDQQCNRVSPAMGSPAGHRGSSWYDEGSTGTAVQRRIQGTAVQQGIHGDS